MIYCKDIKCEYRIKDKCYSLNVPHLDPCDCDILKRPMAIVVGGPSLPLSQEQEVAMCTQNNCKWFVRIKAQTYTGYWWGYCDKKDIYIIKGKCSSKREIKLADMEVPF